MTDQGWYRFRKKTYMDRHKLKDIKIPFDQINIHLQNEVDQIRNFLSKTLKIKNNDISKIEIIKRSLDARGNRPPHFVYSLWVSSNKKITLPKKYLDRSPIPKPAHALAKPKKPMDPPPVIIGAGPAGLFAAWVLAKQGQKPIIIERGPEVKKRSKIWFQFLKGEKFSSEANLLFGEGGAGAYSDGKLTTRIKDPRVKEVLQVFVDCGAPEDTLYDAKPHIGSNYLPAMIRNIRKKIIEYGGIFHFDCRMENLGIENSKVTKIYTTRGDFDCQKLILAMGHSARDTYQVLINSKVHVSAKPFQMGVRVEHPQELIDRNQYGNFFPHPHLPRAEYRCIAKCSGLKTELFSFCMCPGGEILPATEKSGFLCVNGASKHARNTPFANSGLVVTLMPNQFDHDPMRGIALQKEIEAKAFEMAGGNFKVPAQRISDFLQKKTSAKLLPTSYPFDETSVDLHELLPPFITNALLEGLPQLNRQIAGYTGSEAMMVAPETRSCSPMRIDRHEETLESVNIAGLYPVGEGAGYAGGIMSAAVDGMRAAEAILAVS